MKKPYLDAWTRHMIRKFPEHKYNIKMVDELEGDGQRMFAHFVEIEKGHLDIVQAEIDAVTGIGYWYDFREFNLEAY